MLIDLKSCPLCGHKAEIAEMECGIEYNRIKIICRNCDLELNHTQEFMMHEIRDPLTGVVIKVTRIALNESATDVWNRRVNND